MSVPLRKRNFANAPVRTRVWVQRPDVQTSREGPPRRSPLAFPPPGVNSQSTSGPSLPVLPLCPSDGEVGGVGRGSDSVPARVGLARGGEASGAGAAGPQGGDLTQPWLWGVREPRAEFPAPAACLRPPSALSYRSGKLRHGAAPGGSQPRSAARVHLFVPKPRSGDGQRL